MPRGFWGNSEKHRQAGLKSSGNRTRGASRKGGRKRSGQTEANRDSRDD